MPLGAGECAGAGVVVHDVVTVTRPEAGPPGLTLGLEVAVAAEVMVSTAQEWHFSVGVEDAGAEAGAVDDAPAGVDDMVSGQTVVVSTMVTVGAGVGHEGGGVHVLVVGLGQGVMVVGGEVAVGTEQEELLAGATDEAAADEAAAGEEVMVAGQTVV